MTHLTLQAGAPNLTLPAGLILKLEARSTTLDSEVTGVTCSRWAIYGSDESEKPEEPFPSLEDLILPYSG